ncbi:MAG TPA: metallophosphoesterase [bacterium]|nr:metallophosphoesterase [bacterium]
MRLRKYILPLLMISLQIGLGKVSIHDIQYTTQPGQEGTYPSSYADQTVTTGGIVTGVGFNGQSYFISSSSGGEWSGLFVYDDNYSPDIGDSIIVKGEIYEYYGLSEIKNLESFEIISSNNELPKPVAVSTNDLSSEKYESVLVQIDSMKVHKTYDEQGNWQVDDGSGECIIGNGFFNLEYYGFPLLESYRIGNLRGILSYSWGTFRLHPRNISDFKFEENSYILSIPNRDFWGQDSIEIPINIYSPDSAELVDYQLDLNYDSDLVKYSGYKKQSTLSENGEVVANNSENIVQLNYEGPIKFQGSNSLIMLNFSSLNEGQLEMNLDQVFINNKHVEFLSSGTINIATNEEIGDTLTIIQRPLLNIPEIVTPNQTMDIICLADKNTENWAAQLIYNQITLDLPIISQSYDANLDRWFLQAKIPEPDLYELYDLKITADENVDITENAVNIVPQEKDEYYFVHITDPHLPTHEFYSSNPEAALEDTSEITDLREVIKDVNIINPEFVLLTGDLVNEGELEDFQNGRVYTEAQDLLAEFDVPVYLVAGNHDLGGWVDTPPVQGTARRDWWRFFGWKWLQNPPDNGLQTQNYSFDFGSTKYIGMEAYDNYDEYMFDVYGQTSFTSAQIDWLTSEIGNSSSYKNIVLFYHSDFSSQIDLQNLGADMALSGHIHRNQGDLDRPPYNLTTDNTCDNDRAYRVIKVKNDRLEPLPTCYTYQNRENISIKYEPHNRGTEDSVSVNITNHHNYNFSNAEIKFKMPAKYSEYSVSNGVITQIDQSGEFDICYVDVNLPANSSTEVSIKAVGSSGIDQGFLPDSKFRCYPNPFNTGTTIEFSINQNSPVELSIYNIQGQLINKLLDKNMHKGSHSIKWSGYNKDHQSVSAGIYFCKIKAGDCLAKKQILLLK